MRVSHWAQGGWITPLTSTAGQGTVLLWPPSTLCPRDGPFTCLPHTCTPQGGSELVWVLMLETLGGAEPQEGNWGCLGL